jgi:hypothetical protein
MRWRNEDGNDFMLDFCCPGDCNMEERQWLIILAKPAHGANAQYIAWTKPARSGESGSLIGGKRCVGPQLTNTNEELCSSLDPNYSVGCGIQFL